jgi:hypothetical protein
MGISLQNTIVFDGNRNLTNVANITFDGTSNFKLPAGTIAQRPGTPQSGMIRYNSSNSIFERYTTEWKSFAPPAPPTPPNTTLLKGPLQVVSSFKFSSQTTTTTNTYIDITDLSANITPQASNNRIKISASIQVATGTTDRHGSCIEVALYRGATQIDSKTYLMNLTTGTTLGGLVYTSGNTLCFNYMDSPNTTSSVNYNFKFRYIVFSSLPTRTVGINHIDSTLFPSASVQPPRTNMDSSEMYLEEYRQVT